MKTVKVKDRDIVVDLVLGDITKIETEAIVNAANGYLLGGGGVDGAIHRAAGSKLLEACRNIPCDSDGIRCKTGEAYITDGYNLPAKYVIHTVAPVFSGSRSAKNNYIINRCLENCYINCITLADKQKITSIAFPSLGTGAYAWPIELASSIAINASVYALQSTNHINRLVFVVFSQFDYGVYEENLEKI